MNSTKRHSYQVTVSDPEQVAFVRKLLQIYGYEETREGVFEEATTRTTAGVKKGAIRSAARKSKTRRQE